MDSFFAFVIGAATLGVFIWLMIPSSTPRTLGEGEELIDPSDSRQIGMLMGLAGGDVTDAAVARYALERFEQIHGRKATTRDIGFVAGLMTQQQNTD
jgi:hypothetical protein